MVTISIDKLYPHPQNPRGDVGDISELTESIRQNGIFQNLTVIRKSPDKVLLAVCSVSTEDCMLSAHDWYGRPEENQRLNDWYSVLGKLGYSLSDGEKALLDGTHECFTDTKENS